MLNRIKEILSAKFIFTDDIVEILAVALTAKKNCILWGPGGHGKSAMMTEVVNGLGLASETWVQSFGEGLDEAALWGGLDFGKLERDKVLEYFPERSFLTRRIAVFEELFDAPASVLLSLKDTMTSGALRKGAQVFPMRTECIIGLTNREPAELAEMGPAAAALVERFPLQLRVTWPSYAASDYEAMYKKYPSGLNGFTPILAQVIGKAVADGNVVSPRTAIHARDAVIGRAEAQGAREVEKTDLAALRFVPGLEKLGDTIVAEVEAAMARAAAAKALEGIECRFTEIGADLGDTPIKNLQTAKRLAVLENELAEVRCPDELVKKRDGLRQAISQKISEVRRKAEELTRT